MNLDYSPDPPIAKDILKIARITDTDGNLIAEEPVSSIDAYKHYLDKHQSITIEVRHITTEIISRTTIEK